MSSLPSRIAAMSASDGSASRLMRATAASAPSKMTFSVSCTLMWPVSQQVEHVGEHAGPIAVPDDQHVRGRRPASPG